MSDSKPMSLAMQLAKYFDDKGIQRYLFICDDPDSDLIIHGAVGPGVWKIGAVRALQMQIEKTWDENSDKTDE